MTDIERFTQWMRDNHYSLRSFARVVGFHHTALFYMMKRGAPSDSLIVNFIKQYGCDKALEIFADRLSRQDLPPQ